MVKKVTKPLSLFLVVLVALAMGPNPAVAQKKGTIKATMGLSVIGGLFGLFGFPVANAIHIFITDVSNEITASATTRRSQDPNFEVRVTIPDLALARAVTDFPGFPEVVNELQNRAINLQLQLGAVLAALSTATDRFYSASDSQNPGAAQMQLADIRSLFDQVRPLQEQAAVTLEEFAAGLVMTGSDIAIDRAEVLKFQTDLLTGDFSQGFTELLNSELLKIDPILRESVVDPFAEVRRFTLGIPSIEVPGTLSKIIAAEATAIRSTSSIIGPFPGIDFAQIIRR